MNPGEKEVIQLAEWDWVYTSSLRANRLHHPRELENLQTFEQEGGGSGITSCGIHSDWLMIPGIFSRMGMQRCRRCCKIVGYPQGIGSPKNDNTCRPLVEQRLVEMEKDDS